jgi:hypothetical protein
MLGSAKCIKNLLGPAELPGDLLSPTNTKGLHPAIRRVSLLRKRGRAVSALLNTGKRDPSSNKTTARKFPFRIPNTYAHAGTELGTTLRAQSVPAKMKRARVSGRGTQHMVHPAADRFPLKVFETQ